MPDSLFGGGSNQDSNGAPINIPITPVMPPYMKNMTPISQPNMPGQLGLLAGDLQAGGFAPKTAKGRKDIMAWLNQTFRPAQTYNIAPPVKPTTKKSVTPTVNPAGPSGYNYNTAPGRR